MTIIETIAVVCTIAFSVFLILSLCKAAKYGEEEMDKQKRFQAWREEAEELHRRTTVEKTKKDAHAKVEKIDNK